MSQWFLYINMFTHCNCISCNSGMCMIGSCNNHCINILAHLIIHFPEVLIHFSFRIMLKNTFTVTPIHVTKGNDVLVFNVFQISKTHSSYTYTRNIQFIAGCFMAKSADHITGQNSKAGSSCCSPANERPSAKLFVFF